MFYVASGQFTVVVSVFTGLALIRLVMLNAISLVLIIGNHILM